MANHMNVTEYMKVEETLRLLCECGWEGMAKKPRENFMKLSWILNVPSLIKWY